MKDNEANHKTIEVTCSARRSSSCCSLASWALKHTVKITAFSLPGLLASFNKLFAAFFQEQGMTHQNPVTTA